MPLKFTRSNDDRALFQLGILLTVWILLQSARSYSGDEIQFFKKPEIDFWKDPSSSSTSSSALKAPSAPLPKLKIPSSKFDWNKYLDPQNEEFFREGDYIPPAPFIEIAKNPSDDNIENWFKYLQAKNEVLQRVQSKIAEYAQKLSSPNDLPPGLPPQMASQIVEELPAKPKALPLVAPDEHVKRFRLRLYFDSKCPHCERMMSTLKDLSLRGLWLELKQVDADLQARRRIPFPVSAASPTELKQYQIHSVPVLLIGDLKTHTFIKLQGYQTESSVLQTLDQILSKQEGKVP